MVVAADDQVVVEDDAERLGGVGDRPGHVDVGPRRRGVAGGMVVDQAIVTPYLAEKTL